MKSAAGSIVDFLRDRYMVLLTGLAIGLLGVWLVSVGNFPNAGFAPTCFICGTAGALGLHAGVGFQYIYPEIPGFVLGSMIAAYSFKEFKARGGSSPIVRFVLGMFVMAGAQIFLG
jgi:uncharacterized protein